MSSSKRSLSLLIPLFSSRLTAISFALNFLFFSLDAQSIQTSSPHFHFKEIWAYLLEGEEHALPEKGELTDIVYFCARINAEGHLDQIPKLDKLTAITSGPRFHLAIACPHNPALMHWLLQRDLSARDQLIAEIVHACHGYGGVQIDFEGLRHQEAQAYLEFLQALRHQLPLEQLLSVALPARTEKKSDAFDYEKIAALVDRVVVMAYDEHWSGGSAGPIASGDWCEKVSQWSKQTIPTSKLIMGLPLYGRIWQVQSIAKAFKYPDMKKLIEEHHTTIERGHDQVPNFRFEKTVTAVGYFEDIQSLRYKLALYQNVAVQAVAFWRLSQEPIDLWQHLKLDSQSIECCKGPTTNSDTLAP